MVRQAPARKKGLMSDLNQIRAEKYSVDSQPVKLYCLYLFIFYTLLLENPVDLT